MPKKRTSSLASVRAAIGRMLTVEWNVSGEEVAFLLIIAVAVLVRSYAFGDIPPGLNQDEASTAYDAYALLKTGADRHGVHLPVMLISWGNGMYALSSYFAVPFLALFDLSVWSLRLPHLFANIVALFLFYLLTREVTDRRTALIALFLLAINPWHIMVSRWALDTNLLPPFFLLGTSLLVLSLRREKLLPVSFAVFALCLYIYGTAYVIIPFFLAGASVYLLLFRRARCRVLLLSWITCAVVALPIVLFVLINKYDLPGIETPFFSIPKLTTVARFNTETAKPGFSLAFLHAVLGNLAHFWRLVLSQDDGTLYNVLPGYGFLYLFSTPIAAYGILRTIPLLARKRFNPQVFLFLWLLASILVTALLPVNVNRINILFLPLVFFLAVGVRALADSKFVLSTLTAVYLLSFALFTRAYFTTFAHDIAPRFFSSFDHAIDFASEATEGPICVTDHLNMPYIHVLVYRSIDPILFRRTANYPHPSYVDAFGRYTFGLNRCDRSRTAAYLIENGELPSFMESGGYDITHFAHFSVAIPRFPPADSAGAGDIVE